MDNNSTIDCNIRIEAVLTAPIEAEQKAAILMALKQYVPASDEAVLGSISKELSQVAYRKDVMRRQIARINHEQER